MKKTINRKSEITKVMTQARISKNLTQGEVAAKLGYSSPQFISNMERGLSKIPPALIPKLSVIYGISAERLVKLRVAQYEKHLSTYVRARMPKA